MTGPASGARWSHVALNCVDRDRTERFYTELFGFRRARLVGSGRDSVLFLRLGDTYLELFDARDGAPGRATRDGPHEPGRYRHVAFQVPDVDQFLAGIGDRAPITLGPLDFDDVIPGWRTVWIADPDGGVVEVSQGYQDQDPSDLIQEQS